MVHLEESALIDWSACPLVEVVPGKVSGVPLLKGTRLPADVILSNYDSGSPMEEIADNFDMPQETIRFVLAYAADKRKIPVREGAIRPQCAEEASSAFART